MSWLIAWHDQLVMGVPADGRLPKVTRHVENAKKFRTWDEARQWAIDWWGEDIFTDPRKFPISVDQLMAVQAFKKTNGRRWKSLLLWEWDRGDCEPELRQLRNALGPRWLYRQRLIR
jgi:hypothetical protein